MHRQRHSFSKPVVWGLATLFSFAFVGEPGIRADTPLTTERVTTGLVYPLFVTAPPGDSSRLFIVQQTGEVKIFKNGALLPQPFITINVQCCGDSGLLGFAFDPNYATNGYFYINAMRVINATLTSVLERYSVTGNPDVADPNSGLTLLTLAQPTPSHDNNMIAFGPDDGMLYTSFGDGGNQQDPFNRAQDGSLLFGKVLRLDVSNSSPGNLYDIPPDNPFVGDPMVLDEIWALGLRNPWRFSFDRLTSDMYLADVGQAAREEIDFEPGNSPGGLNYGWRCMEGSICSGLGGCTCFSPALTPPIYDYDHSDGSCSVTGGYVYRGCKIPDLRGTYFFADYCTNKIWSFRYVGGTVTEFQERTAELDPPNFIISSITSFGEDADGEIYIVTRGDGNPNGQVFRIVPAGIALGDMNGNGSFDGRDVSAFTLALVNPAAYAAQFPSVDPDAQGDFNCDGVLSLNDRTGFVNALLSD
ncbi:MAG TPA: PQQ-dependent sugar dehydrogenase [Phycisphaerae bacterium]|nr:PQQ-dependent sugar dehydrogenase [Phycisphaerae bacterium]